MCGTYVERVLNSIVNKFELMPGSDVGVEVIRDPELNTEFSDYFVDIEVRLTSKNTNSLALTVWLCSDSIGFSLGDLGRVAKLAGLNIPGWLKRRACAGVEPSSFITEERIIAVCESVILGEVNILVGSFGNWLSGVYVGLNIALAQGQKIKLHAGISKNLMQFVARYFLVGRLVSIQLEKW